MSALALTALTSCGGSKHYEPGTKLKVGLICLHDENSTYDNNFIDAFNKAIETSKAAGYVSESQIERTIPEDQACTDAANRLAKQGCNIIFSDSFGHDDYMIKAAQENPNVIFSGATGIRAMVGGAQNYHNAFASIYEGRYLAGIAGGKALKNQHKDYTGDEEIHVGYVGAFPYAEVISGYTSWFLGLKTEFPNAKMKVNYTYSWYDVTAEYNTALALMDKGDGGWGAVLMSQHADSMGAPTACREKGVLDVSYNIATTSMDPQCADTYVAHSRINWQPYYENVIKSTFEGRVIEGEEGRNWTGSLNDNSVEVQYTKNENILTKENISEIDAVRKELEDGDKEVFDTSTFTVKDLDDHYEKPELDAPQKGADKDYDIDTEGHLNRFMGDTTDDYVRDTNLYEDGYIAESSVRSAPSFDLIIDDIEVPLIKHEI